VAVGDLREAAVMQDADVTIIGEGSNPEPLVLH
jgi:hypothetical protein